MYHDAPRCVLAMRIDCEFIRIALSSPFEDQTATILDSQCFAELTGAVAVVTFEGG